MIRKSSERLLVWLDSNKNRRYFDSTTQNEKKNALSTFGNLTLSQNIKEIDNFWQSNSDLGKKL